MQINNPNQNAGWLTKFEQSGNGLSLSKNFGYETITKALRQGLLKNAN